MSNHQIGICGNIASLKVRLLTPCTRLWEGAKSLKQQTNIYDNTEWLQLSEVHEASENIVSTSRTPISSALQPFTLRLWPQVPNDFLGAWRSRKESCWPSWLGRCSKPQTPRLTQENKSDRNVPTKRWTMIRNNERVMKENESRTFSLAQTLQLYCRITQYHTIFLMLPGQIALKGPHLAKTSSKSLWSLLLRRKHTRNCGVWQSTTTAESKLVSTHSRTLQTPPRHHLNCLNAIKCNVVLWNLFPCNLKNRFEANALGGFWDKRWLSSIALCRGMPYIPRPSL